jgi:hypothetical protein
LQNPLALKLLQGEFKEGDTACRRERSRHPRQSVARPPRLRQSTMGLKPRRSCFAWRVCCILLAELRGVGCTMDSLSPTAGLTRKR